MPIIKAMHALRSPSRRPFDLAVAFLLVAGLVASVPLASQAASDKPTLLGFTSDDYIDDPQDFASEAGRPPAIYQQFWNLDVYPFPDSWVGRLSDYEAQGMIPYF
ncbi:MAG: hypothetical protein PVG83_08040, partial [Acidimicrobiia bacterium]